MMALPPFPRVNPRICMNWPGLTEAFRFGSSGHIGLRLVTVVGLELGWRVVVTETRPPRKEIVA